MTTYPSTAKACFHIIGTDQNVEIGPACFDWNPNEGHRDEHAAKYLKAYLFRNELTMGRPIALRWVTCGPAED